LTVGVDGSFDELFAFVQDVGEVYGRTYTALMRQNRARAYTIAEQQWQAVRRGRYAEFNLALDRGTKFGLETGGRPESILMSLPPQAAWVYNQTPAPGSPEAATQAWLRQGVAWVG
jgi:coproporphyrinogen III oxidase